MKNIIKKGITMTKDRSDGEPCCLTEGKQMVIRLTNSQPISVPSVLVIRSLTSEAR